MGVLMIDDDEDLRTLLEHFIKEHWADAYVEQYDPVEHDMPDASFALGSFDVIILDYMLGRGDGLQWLQQFKRRSDCPSVLFLTAAANHTIPVPPIQTAPAPYHPNHD